MGWPHYEARDEIDGLLFWAGGPIVAVEELDRGANAMLLERCDPGTSLRREPEREQDVVVADLLTTLWRAPDATSPFRLLSEMIRAWADESRAASNDWPDRPLAERGLAAYDALCESEAAEPVVLATDLHAGNVLRARRSPWLVIDPKPYVGDRCYDATQHLMNCLHRVEAQPVETVERVAGLLAVDPERVGRWMFARLATGSGDRVEKQRVARALERTGLAEPI